MAYTPRKNESTEACLRRQEASAAYRQANQARIRDYNRKQLANWRKEHPIEARNRRLWHAYKLPEGQYDSMLDQQNGACAICGTTQPGRNLKHFCLDHNHETGHIRGLLCFDCNILLGAAKDNPETLTQAITYLFKHTNGVMPT